MKYQCEICGIGPRVLTKVWMIFNALRPIKACDKCIYKCQVIGITSGTVNEQGATDEQIAFAAHIVETRRARGVPIEA